MRASVLLFTALALVASGCFQGPRSLRPAAGDSSSRTRDENQRPPETRAPTRRPNNENVAPLPALRSVAGYCLPRPSIDGEPPLLLPYPVRNSSCRLTRQTASTNGVLKNDDKVELVGNQVTITRDFPTEGERHLLSYLLDDTGRVISSRETRPKQTYERSHVYDGAGRIIEARTNGNGYRSRYRYTYAASGLLRAWSSRVEWDNGKSQGALTRWGYDSAGRLLSSTAETFTEGKLVNRRVDEWQYDHAGRPIALRSQVDGVLVELQSWRWDTRGLGSHRIIRLATAILPSYVTTERRSADDSCRPLPLGWYADFSDSIYELDQHTEQWSEPVSVLLIYPAKKTFTHAGQPRESYLFPCAFCNPPLHFNPSWPSDYTPVPSELAEVLTRTFDRQLMTSERMHRVPRAPLAQIERSLTTENLIGERMREIDQRQVLRDEWRIFEGAFAGRRYTLTFAYQGGALVRRARLVDGKLSEYQRWELSPDGGLQAAEWRDLTAVDAKPSSLLTRTEITALEGGRWELLTFGDEPQTATERRIVDASGRLLELQRLTPNEMKVTLTYAPGGELLNERTEQLKDGEWVLALERTNVYDDAGNLTLAISSSPSTTYRRESSWICAPDD